MPHKGACKERIIKQSVRDIEKSGIHPGVLIRSDGEHAILGDVSKTAKQRKGDTVIENTPKGNSQTNGIIERGIQILQEPIRAIEVDLEPRIGCRVEVTWKMVERLEGFQQT